MYNAGAIQATLHLDRTPFSRGLREARAEGEKFARESFTAKVNVNADTAKADAQLAATEAAVKRLDGRTVKINVDQKGLARASSGFAGMSRSVGLLGTAVAALGPATLPVLAAVGVGAAGLSSGLAAAALGAGAFGGVFLSTMSRVNKVEQQAALLRQKAAASSGKQRKAYLDQARALEATLTPAERRMADATDGLRQKWEGLQNKLSPTIWRAMAPFVKLLGDNMHVLAPLVKPAANAIHELGVEAGRALGSPWWQKFFRLIGNEGGTAIQGLGKFVGNLVTGLAHLLVTGIPVFNRMLPLITGWGKAFADWSKSKKPRDDLERLIGFVSQHGPQMISVFQNAGPALSKIAQAAAGFSGGSLTGISVLLQVIGKMNPTEIQAIGVAFAAWKLGSMAANMGGFAKGALQLATKLPVIGKGIRSWAVAQGILDTAMDANPIGLIVLGIAALIAAIVLVIKYHHQIAAVFSKVWGGIKKIATAVGHWFAGPFVHFFTHTVAGGFKTAWNAVKNHVLSAVHGAQNVARTVAHWFTGPFVGFFTRTIPNAFKRGWNAARNHVSTILHGAENVAKNVAGWFTGPFVRFFTHTIPNAFKTGWNAARNHVVTILHSARNGALTVAHWFTGPFLDFYTKTVPNGFKHGWTLAKNHALQILHLARNGALTVAHWFTGPFTDFFTKTIPNDFKRGFTNAKNNALHQFTILRNGLRDAWGWVHDHVFQPMVNFVTDTIPHAFKRGAQLAGQGWNAIKNLAKAPVNFLITTVYDKGIRGIVGKIASWVGKDNPLPYVHALAAGGPVPASQVGWTNQPTAVVGEGNRAYPEVVIPTDPRYRDRALSLFDQVGGHLLAKGGSVGEGPQYLAKGGTIGALIAFGRALQRAHWRVSENPHFGGVHPVHTSGSLHYSGRAIDVNWAAGQSKAEQAKIDALIRSGVARSQYGLRSIWRYPGHYDHVHFDTGAGADLGMRQGHGGGGLGGFLSKLLSPLSMIKDAIAGPVKAMASKFGNSPWVQLLSAIPGKLAGDMAHKAESWMASLLPTGAGGGHAVAASGPVADIVRKTASQFGWGSGPEWAALSWLISAESSWNPRAQNPSSTAYGLGQFLNSTWATVGGHKTSNPALQALYMDRYIKQRYGDPIRAKSYHLAHNSYDTSTMASPGVLRPGYTLAHNGTGRDEYIVDRPPGQVAPSVTNLEVRVFIGNRELRDIIRVEAVPVADARAERALDQVVRAAQLGRK